MPRIALIDDLAVQSVPAGSALLVEFDATSQWHNASLTIAAEWLRAGGQVRYGTAAQPPDEIRSYLNGVGLNVGQLEATNRLELYDFYTVTLGQKSKERYGPPSMKVADLSIWWSKAQLAGPPVPNLLRIFDDLSVFDRFNDEKLWVEFVLTRMIPTSHVLKEYAIRGIMSGVQGDWVYRRLEGAHAGVVDFKLESLGQETRDLIRIRSMKNVAFDRKWHVLRTGENFEVKIEKQ